jgi:hypothetical protein
MGKDKDNKSGRKREKGRRGVKDKGRKGYWCQESDSKVFQHRSPTMK